MIYLKRKALESQLERRVKARRGASEEPGEDDSTASPELGETREELQSNSEDDHGNGRPEYNADDSSTDSEPEPKTAVSFGALVKVQASLQKESKARKIRTAGGKGHMVEYRDDTWENNEALERKAGHKDHRDFSRSNKHAPTEISSKKAVSRKREVIPVLKREYRDPRFEPLSGNLDETKLQKAFSFLDEYREDEMKELKNSIKKTKDENEKERLKRILLSMESKKKAQQRKRTEQEVLDKHKKEEKELVKHGKKPFFLKKAEQNKRVLVEQYSGLKGKQLDHVLERRRKKQDSKEKKKLPWARRESRV